MPPFETVDAETVKEHVDAGDATVINVLSPDQFEQKRIPGTINIPVDEIEERAPEELPDRDAPIIVHCTNTACQASPKAAQKLVDMGYTNVQDFEAGLEGWEEAGYEFEGSEV